MFKDLGQQMKMLKDIKSIQKKLKKAETRAQSADGSVSVTVNGEFEITDIKLDENMLKTTDKSKIEKLILSTANKAIEASKEDAAKEMSKITGGLNIPGLDKFMK